MLGAESGYLLRVHEDGMMPEAVMPAQRRRGRDFRYLAGTLATVGAFVVVSLAIVGPMFGARFGVFDDHEIPYTLSLSGGLPWSRVPAMVAFWVTHDPGRFRPLYWVLRVAETAFWREDVAGWYLDRLLLAIATLACAYALARLWWPPLIAAVAALLVIAGPQAEAWGRLGTQEAYAVPLALVGLALVGRRRFLPGVSLLMLAALTKESFAPLAATGIVWAWFLGSRRTVAAGLLGLSVVAAGVLLAEAGGDYYGLPRTVTGAVSAALTVLTTGAAASAWPAVVGAALLWRARLRWFVLLAIAVIIIVPQAIVYAGIGIGGRYFLPAALGWVVLFGAALQGLRERSRSAFAAAVAVSVVLIAVQSGIQGAGSVARAAATRTWAAEMDEVRQDLRGRMLVVQVSDAARAEAVVALRRYVPAGRAMLAPPPPPRTRFRVKPYELLTAISKAGGYGYDPYERPAQCLEVDFGSVPDHVCGAVVRL
jgi:hypothetical protein